MLTKPVGRTGAGNLRNDVSLVQTLLNDYYYTSDRMPRYRHGETSPERLVVDGLIGPRTIGVIEYFQSKFTPTPDGRVDPRGGAIKRLWPVRYANPTGMPIRGTDKYGSGQFGAPRAHSGHGHDGADYIAIPNQQLVAPLSGRVVTIARSYNDGGIDDHMLQYVKILASDGSWAKLLYMQPSPFCRIDSLVEAGVTWIGNAMTLQRRYPNGMTDHVHLRIRGANGQKINPATVIR